MPLMPHPPSGRYKFVIFGAIGLLIGIWFYSPDSDNSYPPKPRPLASTEAVASSDVSVASEEPLQPINLEYFRLRFVFRSTSDWARLEFQDPERIVSDRIMSVTGDPEVAEVDIPHVALMRPVEVVDDNPVAVLTFDLALPANDSLKPLALKSNHGALRGTGLTVYQLIDGEPVQIGDIDHYWGDGDPEEDWVQFEIDLRTLESTPPSQLDVKRIVPDGIAWAVYYPWIAWDLGADCTDHPLYPYKFSPDGSRTAETFSRAIDQAKSAGIDGFLVSWLEDPTLDENLSILLDVAYRKNFRVAIYLESTPDPEDPTVKPKQIIEWLVHGLSSFGSHPAYMKADNYPLVMVFAANAADVEVWRSIFEEVLSLGYEARYFASAADTAYLDVFVGLHGYTPLPASDNKKLSVEAEYYWSLRGPAPGEAEQKLFMATVMPGIDNCPYGEDPPLVVEREKGSYFRETFASAVQSVPDWMMVTSWNEYGENTHIEPSDRYGSKYLKIAKQEITAWRNPASVEDAKAIARLYSAAFDRNPRVDGLNYWIHVLEGGKTLVQIALKFYESPEFEKKYGPLTDREFVEQLYRNFLGREGLQGGIDFWVARLQAGVSRAKMLERFSESKENVNKTQLIFENMRFEDGQWVY